MNKTQQQINNMEPEKKDVMDIVKELSEKIRYFCGKGQYKEGGLEQKAYFDGVETAVGMMYIDLLGGHKSKGLLHTHFIPRAEVVEKIDKLREAGKSSRYLEYAQGYLSALDDLLDLLTQKQ